MSKKGQRFFTSASLVALGLIAGVMITQLGSSDRAPSTLSRLCGATDPSTSVDPRLSSPPPKKVVDSFREPSMLGVSG